MPPIATISGTDPLVNPGDLHLLSLLQNLSGQDSIDYETEIRPLFAGFPHSRELLTTAHLADFEKSLRDAGSLSPQISQALSELKATLFPSNNIHPALEACSLGNIYNLEHDRRLKDSYKATQDNHANILSLSRCVAALERAKLAQDGDHIDLTEIEPLLVEGARIYNKLTEGADLLDTLDLPADFTAVAKGDVDELLRKLGEGKILEQGRGPQILTLMRKEVELMSIVFQVLQKILEMDSKFKQRVNANSLR